MSFVRSLTGASRRLRNVSALTAGINSLSTPLLVHMTRRNIIYKDTGTNPSEKVFYSHQGTAEEIKKVNVEVQSYCANIFQDDAAGYLPFSDEIHGFPYRLVDKDGEMGFRFVGNFDNERVTIEVLELEGEEIEDNKPKTTMGLHVYCTKIFDNMDYGTLVLEVRMDHTQEGDANFSIEGFRFFRNSKLADKKDGDGLAYKETSNPGMPMKYLEPEVHEAFKKFLIVRGFNNTMAEYVYRMYDRRMERERLSLMRNVHNWLGK